MVRAPMHSVPQPNHALVSLPLVEVNRGKTRCNTVGKGIRYDRTSVRCPLYGPLSAMAVVDEEPACRFQNTPWRFLCTRFEGVIFSLRLLSVCVFFSTHNK